MSETILMYMQCLVKTLVMSKLASKTKSNQIHQYGTFVPTSHIFVLPTQAVPKGVEVAFVQTATHTHLGCHVHFPLMHLKKLNERFIKG